MLVVKLVLAAAGNAAGAEIAAAIGADHAEFSRIATALEQGAHAVVIAPDLGLQLAKAEEEAAALKSWISAIDKVVALGKANRRHVLIVLERDAVENATETAAAIQAWRDAKPLPNVFGARVPDAKEIAAQLLALNQAEARKLHLELLAMAAPVVAHSSPVELASWLLSKSMDAMSGQVPAGSLRDVLQLARDNYAEASLELSQYDEQLDALCLALGLPECNVDGALSQVEALQLTLSKASEARDELIDRLNRSNQKSRNREAGRRDLLRALNERDKEIMGLKEKIAQLKEHGAAIEHALDETYGSTSWRMTAPIRAVRTAFNRPAPHAGDN